MTLPRYFSLFSLLISLSVIGGIDAYSSVHRAPFTRKHVYQPHHTVSSANALTSLNFAAAATTSSNGAADALPAEWEERLESEEVQSIREELVLKYLDKDWPRDKAEQEVDKFLPSKKGRAYIEMRIYSDSQEDMGWETAVTYASAFLIGAVFQIFANYAHT